MNTTLASMVLIISPSKRIHEYYGRFVEGQETLFRAYYWYLFATTVLLKIPTVCGNALILMYFARFRRLRREKPFILVCNLALADLLVGLVALPMEIASKTSYVFPSSPKFIWKVCLIYSTSA
ncbi:hypothetical protein DPMN_036194 [Dreissena polymorpha]|uniref:G-protein coupled receptors family 1 profile domain-containing protein n=1 Tax=Dreissena polymorpha TaxID=45954 RepID=A0A9D4RNN4_DREPO|nr:hypothetical protein DPMN_036194 [Dreissena polymorpha]